MSPHGVLEAVPGAQTGGVRPPPHPRPVAANWHPGVRRSAPSGPPLRGAASHEAEGRRGVRRGGGTGRVRSPTWRLRLLRQTLDELVPGVEQFLLVDDVVAVEDGAALVSGQEHGDPLGDAGADQVAGGGAAAIVEEAGRHASRLAGGAPRRAPAPDGDPVVVEDQRAVGVAACPRAQWSRMWVKTSEAKSPAPNRATPLSGAAIRSQNGMRHPLRRIVGTATAVKLSTMTHPDRTR